MSITNLHTEFNILTIAAPNLAAVRMTSILRQTSFEQALIDQVRDWCTALDEAIDRHSHEAAIHIVNAHELATTPDMRSAWLDEAARELDEVTRLADIRIVAAHMLAGASDNYIGDTGTLVRADSVKAGQVFTNDASELWTITGVERCEAAIKYTDYPAIKLSTRGSAGTARTFTVDPEDQLRIIG